MNLTLKRLSAGPAGIFGALFDDQSNQVCITLEHAYHDDVLDAWVPKVASGKYTCVRHPPNRLPYETFMLKDVPDFQGQPVEGILIHILNYNKESQGCIGVGISQMSTAQGEMITYSRKAFQKVMMLQENLDSFVLEILPIPVAAGEV